MAKQKKKRQKKGRLYPPLSGLDKFIYAVVIALLFIIMFCLVALFELLCNKIAFVDESVIANSPRMTQFFVAPFFFYAFVSVCVCFSNMKAHPIFGNKKVNYSDMKWKMVYPIFGKDKPYVKKTQDEKKASAVFFKLWAVGFAVTVFIAGFSFCGRYVLKNDFSAEKYSVFNNFLEEISFSEYEGVEFDLSYQRYYYSRGHSRTDYSLSANINVKDKDELCFNEEGFKSNGDALREMLKLKELFPKDKLTYYTNCTIEEAAKFWNLSEEEITLLHKLLEE